MCINIFVSLVLFHPPMQHVERPDRSGPADVPPDVTQSAVSALIDGGRQQTNLRDEVSL